MSEEKTASETSQEDLAVSKETRRRAVYPAKDLKSMIEFVAKIYNQLGHTAHISNVAIATLHGLSPESIKQHLSSGQLYKLLELKHGTGYKVTDHFQKLYLPRDENEKRLSVIESLKNPDMYRQLFKDYEYHVVPPDGVKNHFIRSFGFKEEAAVKAAQIFVDNLKDFGLLDQRGVLTSGLPAKPIGATVQDAVPVPDSDTNDSNRNGQENNESQLPARQRFDKLIFQSEIDAAGKKTIPIHLIGDKQAMFVYPDDITEDDIELVKHQVEGILLRIRLEAKKRDQLPKEST
ncbi:MAG: hypothetical protein H0X41_06315 [Chitinophagaceae bacterium]|nr:hypothetical protein [Chitinophagaceae bacterium]